MKAVYNRKWTASSLKLNQQLPAGNLDLVPHLFQCVGDLLTILPLDFDDSLLHGPAAATYLLKFRGELFYVFFRQHQLLNDDHGFSAAPLGVAVQVGCLLLRWKGSDFPCSGCLLAQVTLVGRPNGAASLFCRATSTP